MGMYSDLMFIFLKDKPMIETSWVHYVYTYRGNKDYIGAHVYDEEKNEWYLLNGTFSIMKVPEEDVPMQYRVQLLLLT